jgi:predicted nucleic acid-binding protein
MKPATKATMKVYLDNNIVSAIAKDDHPVESGALDRLLEAKDEGKVHLVTSEVTLGEIKAYRGPKRPPVERTFRLLQKVSIIRWDQLLGINSYGDARSWINAPMIQNDPDFSALLALGVDTVDAQHVFVAAKHACGAFLTCDRGILQSAPAIGKLFGLVVQKPSDFVASQGW